MEGVTDQNHASVAPRRVVTGLDENGRSIICEDAPTPHLYFINNPEDRFFSADFWRTFETPASPEAWDGSEGNRDLPPPRGGTVFRIVQFPPDGDWQESLDPGSALDAGAFSGQDTERHALMHRTASIDYAIVISGEIWAIMDEGETLLKAGDVLIQRATNHSWANRSDAPCAVAFVLVDAAT